MSGALRNFRDDFIRCHDILHARGYGPLEGWPRVTKVSYPDILVSFLSSIGIGMKLLSGLRDVNVYGQTAEEPVWTKPPTLTSVKVGSSTCFYNIEFPML